VVAQCPLKSNQTSYLQEIQELLGRTVIVKAASNCNLRDMQRGSGRRRAMAIDGGV
jgi:hypothetical protein